MQKKNNDLLQRFKTFDKWLVVWQSFAIIFFFFLTFHLFALQVLDIKHYKVKAKNQRMSHSAVLRGMIVDSNGIKLASDKIVYDIWAHPHVYDHSTEELARMLSPILEIPFEQLNATLSKDYRIISLKKEVSKRAAKEISKLRLREISMDKKTERIYPQGALAAHVLGYYNPDADIAGGVEYTAKKELEYIGKKVNFESTPDGDVIYNFSTSPELITSPIQGKTVKLTIDTAIQHVCEEELFKMIEAKKALRGAIIVMNPKNGEILGYSVYPTYDPNYYKKATQTQIKNWSLTDVYPPGSTFKILTVASAMELGKINEFTKVNDIGKEVIGGHLIENYDYRKNPRPGLIDMLYLFEHSSNIGAIRVAQMMTPQEFHGMLKTFGMGSKTGIDLPGESRGILKNPKNWDISDHASMGYGYAISVNAMQMISAVSALANDGVRVTPHVIKYSPEDEAKKVKREQVVSYQTAQRMTRLLSQAIDRGSSFAKLDNYTVAAKTGTSYKPNENGIGYSNKLYTSIVGYLPASDPQIIIYVVVDSPTGEVLYGNTVAAPIFREVALQVARIMNIAPDKVNTKNNVGKSNRKR